MIPSVSPEKTEFGWIILHPRRREITSVVEVVLGAVADVLIFALGRGEILAIPLGILGSFAIATGIYSQVCGRTFRKPGEASETPAGSNIPIVFKETKTKIE